MRTARRLLLLVLALSAFAAGCGGDGEDNKPSAPVPADQSYAAKADAICQKGVARTRRLGREFSAAGITPTTPDLLAVTTDHLVRPGIRVRAQMAEELRALGQPKAGGEAVEAYLELFDPLEELSRLRLHAGVASDVGESHRLETLMQELGEEQQAAARIAGLEACATNFVLAAFGG
ncbi:MAG TPA: hypothetical protein VHP56_12240 [Solirubrobacterales bacterium]|jgi:hypothetical protein|nr:hypothetical protein [Solirubrobacterales bacterium]